MNKLTTDHLTILLLSFACLFLIELSFFNHGGLFFLIVAASLLYLASSKKKKYTLILGLFFLFLAVLNLWSLRLIPILLIGYTLYLYFTKKPEIIKPIMNKPFETEKNLLFDEFETAREYKWQDIQLQKLVGATTIDTTETILPTNRAFITVNQAFGKTTILIPYEVTFELHYSTFFGEATLLHEQPQRLINEKLVFSDGAVDSKRSLVIYVTTWLGDVEVRRV